MSSRICYLERSDLGGLIRSARLISEQADERWELGESVEDPSEAAQSVSAWIADRLRATDGRRAAIDVMCIDVDGGACSWVSAPSADPRVVEAIVRQGSGDDTDFAGSTSPGATLGADAAVPGAATLQPLAQTHDKPQGAAPVDATESRRRLAVLALPDAAVRVVIDELDRLGIDVGDVLSYWHAVAQAWDPSAETTRAITIADDRVVAEDEPATASVVINPSGRLVWTWSRGGELLAAGAMRLVRGDQDEVLVGLDDVGRLSGEWLSWSAQLGLAPNRIVCVAPEAIGNDEGSLGASALGTAIGRAWPGAAIDMALMPDPVGATLERVARRTDSQDTSNPRTSLVNLSNRPGRAHRSMFVWLSAAVLALSVVCAVVAVRAKSISTKTDSLVGQIQADRHEIVQQAIGTEAASQPDWLSQFQGTLRRERKALQAGLKRNELMPIMQEFDTVSFVIGYPDFEIRDLTFGQLNASFTVTVPSIEQYEQLRESLRYVAGSNVNWSAKADEERGSDRVRVRCQGQWIDPQEGDKQ